MENMNINEVINQIKSGTPIETFITRYYVPIEEKNKIITGIVSILTNGQTSGENNCIANEVFLNAELIGAYTSIDCPAEERIQLYDKLQKEQLIEQFKDILGKDAYDFETFFHQKLSDCQAYIQSTRETPADELFRRIAGLLQSVDVDELKKQLTELKGVE